MHAEFRRTTTDGDEMPVDVVIPWVDGREAQTAALMRGRMASAAPPAKRHRDNGELRFALRAIRRNLPWTRRIHLLTNGQSPPWLDADGDGLRLITHSAFFADDRDLPSFSSLAIEANLGGLRRCGVARRFIYSNDDVFIGRPLPRRLFEAASGEQIIHVVPWPIPQRCEREGDAHWHALVGTGELLDRAFGAQRWADIPHAPSIFDLDDLDWLHSVFGNELARTSARPFRSAEDVYMRLLYVHAMAHRAGAHVLFRSAGEEFFSFYRMADAVGLAAHLQEIEAAAPPVFCINDDIADDGEAERASVILADVLGRMFPDPAPWERDAR